MRTAFRFVFVPRKLHSISIIIIFVYGNLWILRTCSNLHTIQNSETNKSQWKRNVNSIFRICEHFWWCWLYAHILCLEVLVVPATNPNQTFCLSQQITKGNVNIILMPIIHTIYNLQWTKNQYVNADGHAQAHAHRNAAQTKAKCWLSLSSITFNCKCGFKFTLNFKLEYQIENPNGNETTKWNIFRWLKRSRPL